MRNFVLSMLALVSVTYLFLFTKVFQTLFAPLSFTESVGIEQGTFFRLKLSFQYKGNLRYYDVVYNCSIRKTHYKDGSRSVEGGLVPALYGRRMDDGHLVAVRTVDACDGKTTANGGIPEKILPLMIDYPNADDPSFGIGYVSDEAFDSELANLKFDKAIIESASREDYLKFRQRADNDLARPRSVTQGIVEDALSIEEAKREGFAIGHICSLTLRVPIPEELRDAVRAEWPADKPRYWSSTPSPADVAAQRDNSVGLRVWRALASRAWRELSYREGGEPRKLRDVLFLLDGASDRGMPNRYGATLGAPRQPAAFYPWQSEAVLKRWLVGPLTPPWTFGEETAVRRAIDLRSGMNRGFAYCGVGEGPLTSDAKFDGVLAKTTVRQSAFENDEYFYILPQAIDAGSMRGRM